MNYYYQHLTLQICLNLSNGIYTQYHYTENGRFIVIILIPMNKDGITQKMPLLWLKMGGHYNVSYSEGLMPSPY